MPNKLIISGKSWGEFTKATRSKGNIVIEGYRGYEGYHTVRLTSRTMDDKYQPVIDHLLEVFNDPTKGNKSIETTLYYTDHSEDISNEDFIPILQKFIRLVMST